MLYQMANPQRFVPLKAVSGTISMADGGVATSQVRDSALPFRTAVTPQRSGSMAQSQSSPPEILSPHKTQSESGTI